MKKDASSLLWKKVTDVLRKYHHTPDLEAVRAVYSAKAAHRLPGQPVWMMYVAPPGSMKTETVAALDGLPKVHLIDQITPNTFISGQIRNSKESRGRSSSLLHRVGPDGILIYPDFSTILSMKFESRASILADMRRIYDGKLSKEYGTADTPKEHTWQGRITFLVAATPDVDGHYSIFQTLGERFLMVRSHRPGGIKAALTAMNQDTIKAKQALRDAVHMLFHGLPNLDPTLPFYLQAKIAALTEFAVLGRTSSPRNGYSKQIIYVPEPEAATRMAQQLAQLVKGSALLAGRQKANTHDYKLALRVAFDCIPDTKRRILDACTAGKELSTVTMPGATRHYAQEDLECQGLLKDGKLSTMAHDLLRKAGVRNVAVGKTSRDLPP